MPSPRPSGFSSDLTYRHNWHSPSPSLQGLWESPDSRQGLSAHRPLLQPLCPPSPQTSQELGEGLWSGAARPESYPVGPAGPGTLGFEQLATRGLR